MADLKAGDRVRVTYEGVYAYPGAVSGHYLEPSDESDCTPFVPAHATIEVIKPEAKEPKAFGSLVEVDGEKWVRADVDGPEWRGESGEWEDWDALQAKGNITVLFDPDAAQEMAVTQAKPESPVWDSEGDRWEWLGSGDKGPGYYLSGNADSYYYQPSREYLAEKYGPLSPF